MILRRLIGNLKEQKWLSLSLELIILVLGVFLGLQVDEWNQNRQDRIDEALYMKRFTEEVNVNITELQLRAETHIARGAALHTIWSSLTGGAPQDLDAQQVEFALCYWHIPEALETETTIYDEIVATGRFGVIADDTLRRDIQAAYAAIDTATFNRDLVGSSITEIASEIRPYIYWRPSEENYGATCTVDFNAIKNSPHALSVIAELVRGQLILAQLSTSRLERLQALEAKLTSHSTNNSQK